MVFGLIGVGFIIFAVNAVNDASNTPEAGRPVQGDAGELLDWAKTQSWGKKESVSVNGDTLVIDTTGYEPRLNPIYSAGSSVLRIVKNYKQPSVNQEMLKTIRIVYQAELIDKYNKSLGIRPALTMEFDVPEALKYNLTDSYEWDMVETAKITHILKNDSEDILNRYCSGSSGEKYSPPVL